MNKFLFKSTNADFQKLLQQINQNILYVTYVVDKISKKLYEMDTDDSLKTQVDKYFEEDEKIVQDEDKEPD